ncbi:unnamed protein product [Adineta steineri]|uniref:Phosducin domain-containing protein n=1 Tax=Adineta steineri TaxID=433720 RepID=A0A814FQP6_9BILA|nr:unnamed protein product [Adineta steineri]
MEIEVINNSNGILLSSAMAFIGSQGRRTSNKTWIYHWANTTDKIYTSTSQMWCKEKYWNTIVISQGEPAWEKDEEIDITFQALKRWSDSDDACLISLLPNSRQPILCEIIGESDRFRNQSILPFLFTTITTTTTVSSIKTTTTTTTMKDIVINNLAPLTILWSLSTTIFTTSSATTVETNLTNVHSEIKQNGSLFIILGILGILTIISILIFIIYIHHKKKESSIDLKSNTKQSLSHSKMDQIHVEDLQSNDSSESHFTVETATQESDRIFTDTHSLTPNDEEAKKQEEAAQEKVEDEFFDAEDEFFKEYRAKLMHQMQQRLLNTPRFGKQVDLTRENFTNSIDDENKNVTIIVHVFEQSAVGCKVMNNCFQCLAEQYPYVKFCRIQASEAQLSHNFVKNGCPALLVYRGGELLSSFISITNKLGDDFVASDVESLLQESGYLSAAECDKNTTVRDSQIQKSNQSDTDED